MNCRYNNGRVKHEKGVIGYCRRFTIPPQFSAMGVTPIELFRSGNSTHSRLHEVVSAHDPGTQIRVPDVDSYVDAWSQAIWVSAAAGNGASCWNALGNWRKPWRLPAGSSYPDTLRLWNDDNPPGHWTWAPAYDMPLDDFKAALALVTQLFKPHP
jgi:hypothetical protein